MIMKVAALKAWIYSNLPIAIPDKKKNKSSWKEEVLVQSTSSAEARLDIGQASSDRPQMLCPLFLESLHLH